MDDFKVGDYRFTKRDTAATALTFLIVGLGIGAVAALLLAPKTGKQMRKLVRRKYDDAREGIEDIGDRAGDVWEKGSEWASNTKERVAPMVRKLRRD